MKKRHILRGCGVCIALLALSGCSYLREEGWLSPKKQQSTDESVTVSSIERDKQIEEVKSSHQPRADVFPIAKPRAKPMVTALHAENLTGLDPRQIEDSLGQPDIIETQGPTLVWRFNAGPCTATFQFFKEVETDIYRLLQYDFEGGSEAYCLGRIERRKFG